MVTSSLALPPALGGQDGKRLPQQAYETLRQAIRTLGLAPGRMVREREVVEALGMSRTPVREALVRLEMEGWVALMPRHGFIVAPLSADDLREIYEIVEGLEWMAAALAAERARPEDLAELERLVAAQASTVTADDRVAWADLDDRFHNRIVEMAGNARLLALWDTYNDQVYRARLFTVKLRPKPVRSLEEHRAIVAAMKLGDPKAARALLQTQRRRAAREVLEIVRAIAPVRE